MLDAIIGAPDLLFDSAVTPFHYAVLISALDLTHTS